MIPQVRAFFAGLCVALLLAGAVLAQDQPLKDVDQWENVATRAEAAVADTTSSDTVLEALRTRIAGFSRKV